jgi:aerobic carbon-monoxide dehydrogenase large subunit
MAGSGSILGNSVLRLEDPTLLTGDGKYVDDLRETGMFHVALVRSPVAHGDIQSVDIGEAESMPGVVAVFHAGNDLGMPAMQGFPMLPPDFNRPIFASERVRFVGDIIAAVVAESQAQANDAAQEIFADIEPLPAIIDPRDGLAPDAPLLFPDTGSNICFASHFPPEGGGDDPCEGAAAIAEVEMVSQRLAGVPMENNGVVCIPEDDGGLTMWVSHQAPHSVHAGYAPMLGLEPERLRIVCPWVGGGFGPKAAGYAEHLIAGKAALALGKPVKWVEARSENMVSMVHGRDFVMKARLGVNDDGTIVGFDGEVVAAGGAYPAIGAILPMLTQMMSVGVYEIPKVRFDAKTVLTNNTTIGAYRGAGRPEATQLIERVLDVAADLIGMDPAEIRRVNFMQPDSFPRTTITGGNYDSGEYEKALDAVLEASDYQGLLRQQAERRASGDVKQLGIGVSAYVEVTAPGRSARRVRRLRDQRGRLGDGVRRHERARSGSCHRVRDARERRARHPDGQDHPGQLRHGQGASRFGHARVAVAPDRRQRHPHRLERRPRPGQADRRPHARGVGRRHRGRRWWPAGRGCARERGEWAELAAASRDASKLPEGLEPGPLRHELDFDGQDSTFPFGAHVSVVEVDTETGQVKMLRHVAVDDCGRILNPLLVRGQQHGGIAQGAAQALFEQVMYDSDGNPITSNVMDYAIPSAAELCSFETSNTETDSPRNPLGAKGIGESGTIGSTPAIQNAVVDAVSHLGVTHIDMPCTAERVWQAIQAAQR